MTDTEIRIAIAEKCGWLGPFGLYRRIASGKQLLGGGETLHGTPPRDKEKPKDDQAYEPVPDFLNDLNACHEFEETLDALAMCEYGDLLVQKLRDEEDAALGERTGRKWPLNGAGFFRLAHASARQRCEAFLRVHGLWKE